jgi:hypothetical protein
MHQVKLLFSLTTLQIFEDTNHKTLNLLASIPPKSKGFTFL